MKKFNVSYVLKAESISDALGSIAYPYGDRNDEPYDDVMVSEVRDA